MIILESIYLQSKALIELAVKEGILYLILERNLDLGGYHELLSEKKVMGSTSKR